MIELKGTPPNATAVVWNTIGLNGCPPEWWESLSVPGAIKNGPRHFTIRSAAELAQTPYTDRTIARRNVWRWKRHRLVYELVAPAATSTGELVVRGFARH